MASFNYIKVKLLTPYPLDATRLAPPPPRYQLTPCSGRARLPPPLGPPSPAAGGAAAPGRPQRGGDGHGAPGPAPPAPGLRHGARPRGPRFPSGARPRPHARRQRQPRAGLPLPAPAAAALGAAAPGAQRGPEVEAAWKRRAGGQNASWMCTQPLRASTLLAVRSILTCDYFC